MGLIVLRGKDRHQDNNANIGGIANSILFALLGVWDMSSVRIARSTRAVHVQYICVLAALLFG